MVLRPRANNLFVLLLLRAKQKDADTRDRTRDLQIFSLTLSQLSYIGGSSGARLNTTSRRNKIFQIKKYPWRDLNPQSSDS